MDKTIPPDEIIVKDLLVRNIIGVDNWERKKKQDILINIKMLSDITMCGETDQISNTISYSTVCKEVAEFTETTIFKSVEGLAEGIASLCISKLGVQSLVLRVEKPRALLYAGSAGVEIRRSNKPEELSSQKENDFIFISDLLIRTIIGVNPWERLEKQNLVFNLTIWPKVKFEGDFVPKTHNYRTISHSVVSFVEESSYKTIEALAQSVAELLVMKCHARKVTIQIQKPSALLPAKYAGIQITRDERHFPLRNDYQGLKSDLHVAYIGLGSNLGDKSSNISEAIKLLKKECQCHVVDTSFMYETKPMHVEEQPCFLNAVCKVYTPLSAETLLESCKQIEEKMGRTKTIRFGPRLIDLDILFFDDQLISTPKLEVPHPRIQEREFVLRPLCDIESHLEHPILYKTVGKIRDHMENRDDITKVIPIGSKTWKWGEKTYLMGVLNITPDSFSDGGKYFDVEAAFKHASDMQKQGADIIDIGGMSSKPNAEEISIEEEIARVVPVIKRLKRSNEITVPISIDTFRSQVARAAIEAGANMINDISGGARDPEMYQTMAELNVPVCLMHMRGDSSTMLAMKDYGDDLIDTIRKELKERVQKALKAGVHRWNIIIDPGFGFAKKPEQSVKLLTELPALLESRGGLEGFPTLAGPSRKGFIGSILNQPNPEERVWGTAATCSALVASKVDILRVHDVKEMYDVTKVSDAIWRNKV